MQCMRNLMLAARMCLGCLGGGGGFVATLRLQCMSDLLSLEFGSGSKRGKWAYTGSFWLGNGKISSEIIQMSWEPKGLPHPKHTRIMNFRLDNVKERLGEAWILYVTLQVKLHRAGRVNTFWRVLMAICDVMEHADNFFDCRSSI